MSILSSHSSQKLSFIFWSSSCTKKLRHNLEKNFLKIRKQKRLQSYTIVCRRKILCKFLLYTNKMCTKTNVCSCHMTQCNIKIQIHILSVQSYLLCIKLKSVIFNHQNVLIIIQIIFHLNCCFQGTIIFIILYSYKYFIKVIVIKRYRHMLL